MKFLIKIVLIFKNELTSGYKKNNEWKEIIKSVDELKGITKWFVEKICKCFFTKNLITVNRIFKKK
jgi:hypothetical protein